MKKYYEALGFGILWGAFDSLRMFNSLLVGRNPEYTLSRLVMRLGIYNTLFGTNQIIDKMIDTLPLFIFLVLYGVSWYKRFCTAGVYYFSRCTNRIRWFIKESIQLYIASLLYFTAIAVTCIICVSLREPIIFDEGGKILLIYYLAIYSLWAYSMAVIMNVVSLKKGSSVGLISVVTIQTVCIYLLKWWDIGAIFDIKDTTNMARNLFLLKCNPISHLTFGFHSGTYESVKNELNRLGPTNAFAFSESVIALMILTTIVLLIAGIVVKKHEMIQNNVETGLY